MSKCQTSSPGFTDALLLGGTISWNPLSTLDAFETVRLTEVVGVVSSPACRDGVRRTCVCLEKQREISLCLFV